MSREFLKKKNLKKMFYMCFFFVFVWVLLFFFVLVFILQFFCCIFTEILAYCSFHTSLWFWPYSVLLFNAYFRVNAYWSYFTNTISSVLVLLFETNSLIPTSQMLLSTCLQSWIEDGLLLKDETELLCMYACVNLWTAYFPSYP